VVEKPKKENKSGKETKRNKVYKYIRTYIGKNYISKAKERRSKKKRKEKFKFFKIIKK